MSIEKLIKLFLLLFTLTWPFMFLWVTSCGFSSQEEFITEPYFTVERVECPGFIWVPITGQMVEVTGYRWARVRYIQDNPEDKVPRREVYDYLTVCEYPEYNDGREA